MSGLKAGVENYIFWSEIGSGFGEPGGTPPPRIPRSTPSPGRWKSEAGKVKIEKRARHNAHHFTAYDLMSSFNSHVLFMSYSTN